MIVSKSKPSVAAEGDASPIEVANWDQETNVLFEDDNSQDMYAQDNVEPSTLIEEQDMEEKLDEDSTDN